MKMAILRAALGLAESATEPGVLVDLPYVWSESFAFEPGKANM